jgi:hypothetical protein
MNSREYLEAHTPASVPFNLNWVYYCGYMDATNPDVDDSIKRDWYKGGFSRTSIEANEIYRMGMDDGFGDQC